MDLFNEYKKAIPFLTIDNTIRKQFELDKVQKEKSELEKINNALKQTVKAKDDLADKYRNVIFSSATEELISEKIKDVLKVQKQPY